MEFNMEWTQICRVCLQEGEMQSIFDNSTNIYEKLMQCSSIKINRNVNLPKQICKNCIQDLEIAYKFHTNCESSDAILKSYIETTCSNLMNEKKCPVQFEDKLTSELSAPHLPALPDNNHLVELNTNCRNSKKNNSIFIKSYKFCPPAGLKVRRINGTSSELLQSNLMVDDLMVKQENTPNISANDDDDDYVDKDQGNDLGKGDENGETETLPKTIIYDDDDEENNKTLLLISDEICDDGNFIDRDDYIEFLIHGDLDTDIIDGGDVDDGDDDDIDDGGGIEDLQKSNEQELVLSNQKYISSLKNGINNENNDNLKAINVNTMELIIDGDTSNINLINNVDKYLIEDCQTRIENNMFLNVDYEQTKIEDMAAVGTLIENEEIMHIKPVRCSKNLRYGKSHLDGNIIGVGVGKSGGGSVDGTCNTIRSKENIEILTTSIMYNENMPVYQLKRCTASEINQQRHNKPLRACEICGNQYKHQHALESHMRRHRNEKPFKCEICGKAFVINFELNRHKRTHTGQKPYACTFCDRKFSDFGSRIKHERTHTGERPYKCSTCGKSFAYSHVLNSHNLTHTGEKKYHCEKCGKRFTKSHHLKAHMNTHDKNRATKSLVTADYKTIIRNQLNHLENINENVISDGSGGADGATVIDHNTHHFVDETTIIPDEKFRKFSLQYSTTFDINDVTHMDALMGLPD